MIISTQTVSIKDCGSCEKDHDNIKFVVDRDSGVPYVICPTNDERITIDEDHLPGANGLAAQVESLHNFCRHLDDKTTQLGMAIIGDEQESAVDAELDEIDAKLESHKIINGKPVH